MAQANLGVSNLIVVDGGNVAYECGKRNFYDCRGVLWAYNFFRSGNYDFIIILPRFIGNGTNFFEFLNKSKSEKILEYGEWHNLDCMHEIYLDDRITYPPDGEYKQFLVSHATDASAMLISTDTFDKELTCMPECRSHIQKAKLSFTFFNRKFSPKLLSPRGDEKRPDRPEMSPQGASASDNGNDQTFHMNDWIRHLVTTASSSSSDNRVQYTGNSNVLSGLQLSVMPKPSLQFSIAAENTKTDNQLYRNNGNNFVGWASSSAAKNPMYMNNPASAESFATHRFAYTASTSSGLAEASYRTPMHGVLNLPVAQKQLTSVEKVTYNVNPAPENKYRNPSANYVEKASQIWYNTVGSYRGTPSVSQQNHGKQELARRENFCSYGCVTFVADDHGYITSETDNKLVYFSAEIVREFYKTDFKKTFVQDAKVATVFERKQRGVCPYSALVVRLEKDILVGYASTENRGANHAYVRAESQPAKDFTGESSIFCPIRVFSDNTVTFSSYVDILQPGMWVKVWAIPQPNYDFCRWISVKMTYARATGVVVKSFPGSGFMWCREAQKVFIRFKKPYEFNIGDWVTCSLVRQAAQHNCYWAASDPVITVAPYDVSCEVKTNVDSYGTPWHQARLTGVGIMCASGRRENYSYGSVWANGLGKMKFANAFTRKAEKHRYDPHMAVFFEAYYDRGRVVNNETTEDGWQVFSLTDASDELAKRVMGDSEIRIYGGRIQGFSRAEGVATIITDVGVVKARSDAFHVAPHLYHVGKAVRVGLTPGDLAHLNWRVMFVVEEKMY